MKLPQVDQCAFHVCKCTVPGIDSDYGNNVISTKEMFFLNSITFPDQPCKAMPYNTVPYFLTDRNPQPVPAYVILPYIHDKIFIRIGFPCAIYDLKIFIFL